MQVKGIILISDQWERAQFIVGDAISRLVVLGPITKQVDQAMKIKPEISIVP